MKTAIAAAVIAVVGIGTVAYTQHARAISAEQKAAVLQARADAAEKELASLRKRDFGQCGSDKLAATDSNKNSVAVACLALGAALDRDDGKSEAQTLQWADSVLQPGTTDDGRDLVNNIVHRTYTDFSALSPAAVYGAVYVINRFRNEMVN